MGRCGNSTFPDLKACTSWNRAMVDGTGSGEGIFLRLGAIELRKRVGMVFSSDPSQERLRKRGRARITASAHDFWLISWRNSFAGSTGRVKDRCISALVLRGPQQRLLARSGPWNEVISWMTTSRGPIRHENRRLAVQLNRTIDVIVTHTMQQAADLRQNVFLLGELLS
jgi:hypothetical protein